MTAYAVPTVRNPKSTNSEQQKNQIVPLWFRCSLFEKIFNQLFVLLLFYINYLHFVTLILYFYYCLRCPKLLLEYKLKDKCVFK
jgi:hypothetical protein